MSKSIGVPTNKPGLDPFQNLTISENKFRSEACDTLISCGLSEITSKKIVETFLTWSHASGIEWANARWKDLRLWYETSLNAQPVIPKWWKHRKGVPVGCFKHIFQLKDQEKAFLALSINTLLVAKQPLPSQIKKVCHGISGNGFVYSADKKEKLVRAAKMGNSIISKRMKHSHRFTLRMSEITEDDLQGKSSICVDPDHAVSLPRNYPGKAPRSMRFAPIPLQGGNPTDKEWDAYLIANSYFATPEIVRDFLFDHDLLYMSVESLFPTGHHGHQAFGPSSVASISVIQEEQLKLRTVVNGPVMVQKTLEPLGDLWYDKLEEIGYDPNGDRKLHVVGLFRDCTFNQQAGCLWIQQRLARGESVNGVDLTSATDLISVDAALDLVNNLFFPDLMQNQDYLDLCKLFVQIAKSPYSAKNSTIAETAKNGYVQGQGMGFYPSFALLGLVNNAAAFLANVLSNVVPYDSYTALGDDMSLTPQAEKMYTYIMTELLGCEINSQKTVRGNVAAEFAGRVITKDNVFHKATKLKVINDSNFMSQMSKRRLTKPSKLKPRQRAVWNEFKYVPGVLVPGDEWSQDSYGEPLKVRYQWYLTVLANRLDGEQQKNHTIEPDLAELNRQYSLGSFLGNLGVLHQPATEAWRYFCNPTVDPTRQVGDSYVISDANAETRNRVNRRLQTKRQWQRSTISLRMFERIMKSERFVPYATFKREFEASYPPNPDTE